MTRTKKRRDAKLTCLVPQSALEDLHALKEVTMQSTGDLINNLIEIELQKQSIAVSEGRRLLKEKEERANRIRSGHVVEHQPAVAIRKDPVQLARDHVDKVLEKVEKDSCAPRRFAITGLQKAAGLPLTGEGKIEARKLTAMVLEDLKRESRIVSWEIMPRIEDGWEWAFFQLPRKSRRGYQ